MDMRPLKQALALMLVAVMVFLLSSCDTAGVVKPQEMPTVLGELSQLEGEEGSWLGLTAEEKTADFDYLYQTLQENYPYFHVLERMYDVNLEQVYQQMRPKAAESASDAAFFAVIEEFTRSAQMVGHLSTVTPMDYDWYVRAYQNKEGIPESEWPQMERLYQQYGNQDSRATYAAFGKIFWPVMDTVQQFYADAEADDDTAAAEGQTDDAYANVETRILEPGQIAYIAINSFDMANYSADRQTLLDFYRAVRDYPHVIIDLTHNGGGGMEYFNDLVVAPNITEALSCQAYALAKRGANNAAVLDFTQYQPISQLPELAKMNREDLQDLDAFLPLTYRVEPIFAEKMMQGRLWLLVGPQVFSSSEYAAMFSKATGFATLVGTGTGGDGIGTDPAPIILPNSGLIVRYSAIYGVTADGLGSQEFGTAPDILSREGESALDTCQRAIAQTPANAAL